MLEYAYKQYYEYGSPCSFGLISTNPAFSCSEIFYYGNLNNTDGLYWIKTDSGLPTEVYCARDPIPSRRIWGPMRRVGYLDMTKPEQNCPSSFKEFNSASKRLCARRGCYNGGCSSVTFNTSNITYSEVCGRVKAYQYGSPSGFASYRTGTGINTAYVEGVSITRGTPRQHVWSFANAFAERTTRGNQKCPACNPNYDRKGLIPSFVGDNFFCDTGSLEHAAIGTLYTAYPLWDGEGGYGSANSTCFAENNPPWFCKELPEPSTENIELRLCADEAPSNEDSPIEQIEIYVN